MKKISFAIVAFMALTMMSCQKEYSCVCAQGSAQIVQASDKTEAVAVCDAKGSDCDIQ